MKQLIFTFLLAACVTAAMAVPAKRIQRVVEINGRSVTLTFMGDESLHFWQAEDGTAYRLLDGGKVELLDLKEAMAKAVKRNTEQQLEFGTVAPVPDGMRRADQMQRIRYQGERHGLVILANFADKQFTCSDDPRAEYERVVAEKDYSGNGQHGSVRDYFLDQSYGQFDFVLDVAGPVTLSKDMKYYGENDSNGSDLRAAYMVKEACELVDDEVDFSKYDWDGDGRVEQVYVVYAGYGEAQYGGDDTIWPHAWSIYAGTRTTLKLDGVIVNTYACSSELTGNKGSKMDGIGTICHEFSHCFGLPDFYCTDYNHNELTMSSWSILDQGSYNNNGYCPPSYTAYERWFCGWLTPTVLSEPVEIEGMKSIDVDGESYILYNQGNANEYYIMYNVQKTGWNTYVGGHGMLVLHVDYNKTAWDYNTPNVDANHLRMTPICADNRRSTTTLAGDPYPGTSKNTSLTDTSKPAAELFNNNIDGRKFMGKPIEQITETAAKISFVFDGGSIAGVPVNLQVTEGADEGFTAVWDEAENAVSYNIEYGEYKMNQEVPDPLAYELFDSLDASNTADISGRLDDYTTLKGFTGALLYEANKGLRFGSMSKPQGNLVTPELDFSGLDDITVTFMACNYNASKAKITVTALDAEGNELSSSDVTIPSTALSEVQVSVGVKGAVRLKIAGSLRFYLHSLMIGGVAPSPYGVPVLIENVTDTQLSIVPEDKCEAYYVRVRSVNKYSKMSDWTDYVIIGDGNAVEAVHGDAAVHAVYSIDGRRVFGALTRGIYVIDGKKRVIR